MTMLSKSILWALATLSFSEGAWVGDVWNDMTETAKDAVYWVKDQANEGWEQAKDMGNAMKDCVTDIQGCTQDQIEKAKELAEDTAERAKQLAEAAKDMVEDQACPNGGAEWESCTHTGLCACKEGLQCVIGKQQCMKYGNPGESCVPGVMQCRADSFCQGTTCALKGTTGDHCIAGIQRCQEYCTMFPDPTKNYCAPWDGAPIDYTCKMDRQCSKNDNLWCNGGTVTSYGQCSRCPHFCKPGEGCHSCEQDQSRLKCGRMTDGQAFSCAFQQTADVVEDYVGCMFGIDMQCGVALAKQTAKCVTDPSVDENCEFKVGCADEYGITKEYTKKWYARPVYITVFGSVEGKAKPDIKFNPSKGYINLDIEWNGEIKAYIKAEMDRKKGSLKISKPLAKPMTILRKFFVVYFIPVMIEVKVQPYFWGTMDAIAGAFEGEDSAEVFFGVSWTNWAKLRMNVDIGNLKADILEKGAGVGDGNMNFLANGKVSVAMAGYVGMRVSVEVNKVSAALDLAGAIKVDANVDAKIGNGEGYKPADWKNMIGNIVTGKDVCIKGGVHVAAGVAVRSNVGFSIPNPKDAARDACNWSLKRKPGVTTENKKDCQKKTPENMPLTDMCNSLVDRIPKALDVSNDAVRLLSPWNFFGGQTEVKIPTMEGCDNPAVVDVDQSGKARVHFSDCYDDLRGKTIDFLSGRIEIDCNDEPLNGFKLEGDGCDWPALMWRQNCGGTDVVNADVVELKTNCNWFQGEGPIFLDRHDVQCPEGRVLRSFDVDSEGCSHEGDRYFKYKCVKAEYDGDVVQKETACQIGGHLTLEYIDRHDVKCDDGFAMTGFKVAPCADEYNAEAADLKFMYGCVRTKELTDVPAVVADLDSVTEHILDHATILARNICTGSKDSSFARFTIPGEVTAVDDIALVFKDGGVSCWGEGKTKFGCGNDERIAMFITDEEDNVIVPADHHDGAFYFMEGFTGDSPTLIFQDEVDWNAGWTYRVWFGEDLFNTDEEDNSDQKTCFDVYATGVEGMNLGDPMPIDCWHEECNYGGGKCSWCDDGANEGYCCRRGMGDEGCPDGIGTLNYHSCIAKEGDKWYYSVLDDGSLIKILDVDLGGTPLSKDARSTTFTEILRTKGTEVALIASVLLISVIAAFAFKNWYFTKNPAVEFKPLLAV